MDLKKAIPMGWLFLCIRKTICFVLSFRDNVKLDVNNNGAV